MAHWQLERLRFVVARKKSNGLNVGLAIVFRFMNYGNRDQLQFPIYVRILDGKESYFSL